MKKIINLGIFLLIGIVLISSVNALGFSPSSLTFNQNGCQDIYTDFQYTSYEILWANSGTEHNPSLYTQTSNISVSITQDNIILGNQVPGTTNHVSVCLNGNIDQDALLILSQAEQGEQVLQAGIWIEARLDGNTSNDYIDGNSTHDNDTIKWIVVIVFLGTVGFFLFKELKHKK